MQSSRLILPSAGVTDVCHHTQCKFNLGRSCSTVFQSGFPPYIPPDKGSSFPKTSPALSTMVCLGDCRHSKLSKSPQFQVASPSSLMPSDILSVTYLSSWVKSPLKWFPHFKIGFFFYSVVRFFMYSQYKSIFR
jgi:hypothetical protein